MMTKKQKKSRVKKPKRIKPKIYEAQKRNEFIKKLQLIAEAAEALDAFKLIPKNELRLLSITHFRSFRVEIAPDFTISPALLHGVNQIVKDNFRHFLFPILPDGPNITMADWVSAGGTLRAYVVNLQDTDYKNAAEVKKGFQAFINYTWEKNLPEINLVRLAIVIGGALSNIRTHFLFFIYDICDRQTSPPYIYERFVLRYQKAEKKNLRIDGISRPAYRVGWPLRPNEVIWATVKPGDLNIPGAFSQLPLDVYAQSHALLRMLERLDCLVGPEYLLYLYLAFTKIQTKVMPNGQTLVEYRIQDIVVGYLVIQIVDGIALIRTFLFKTQSGTPEGDRLHQTLGLKRVDAKYMELDKLSTFVRTDLKQNQEIISLFAQAGCDDLFKLILISESQEAERKLAERIASYLNLNKGDPEISDWSDAD